ncbi:Tm-1-like ATP-binding domain-containing protein [Halomonas sp.]|uniref:Tm-1-like ATP-binding domain-containing protein n=1 Tax=Halomonas sp. TaxID=1486246 RepID=UPI003A0FC679
MKRPLKSPCWAGWWELHKGQHEEDHRHHRNLDTKGPETRYARDLVVDRGYNPLVVDCGMLGEAAFSPETSREEVARAAGSSLDAVRAMSKSDAIETMSRGAGVLVETLFADDGMHAILGLGGGQGTVIATAIMKRLPFGLPKVMVSGCRQRWPDLRSLRWHPGRLCHPFGCRYPRITRLRDAQQAKGLVRRSEWSKCRWSRIRKV